MTRNRAVNHDTSQPRGIMSRRTFLVRGALGACAGAIVRPSEARAEPGLAGAARLGDLQPVRAQWFEPATERGVLRCVLCPWRCELREGQRGRCRVREQRNGRGVTLVHGRPALARDDPIELLPFFHVTPGERVLAVSTAGCNLECKFCEVWDMALSPPEEVLAYAMTPANVVSLAQAAEASAVGFAFGEPVVFIEYAEAIASLAREAGLKTLLQSAGYLEDAPLRRIASLLDGVNIDLKAMDEAFYERVVGGTLQPVLRTLKTLRALDLHLEVTNVLIPTLNDAPEQVRALCRWVHEELGRDTPLHFSRFYPLYRLANLPRTPVATLTRAREIALETGLRYVYLGKVPGHAAESTVCPECAETVIRRVGFVVDEVRLRDGRCAGCGATIPGLWE